MQVKCLMNTNVDIEILSDMEIKATFYVITLLWRRKAVI